MVSSAITAAVGATSVNFFDFRAFFGRAITSVVIVVPFHAGPVAVGASLFAFFRAHRGSEEFECSWTSKLASLWRCFQDDSCRDA